MATILENFLMDSLNEKKEKGLLNQIDILEKENGPEIQIKGKTFINFASNNYLGLATHPDLKKHAIKAIEEYGVGAGAVRTINGSLSLHQELETEIAKFKGTEAAIAFQSGFNCNMGVISALMTKEDAILSDELNHASIIDGCRLSGAKIIRVKHSDMDDLYQKAKEVTESKQYKKIMYITDGVFSMDGDVAKLPEIVEIAKEFDLITYVDDAHGSGVMGKGAGTVKHFGLNKDIDVQMGTLSKAIGVVGGYVAGRQSLIDWLKVSARPFLFSTAATPADTAAAIKAISILTHSHNLQETLWRNARYLQKGLQQMGYSITATQTPITPVIIGDEKLTQEFSKRLFNEKIYAKAIVFPTVPLNTGRIRNMPIATHTQAMLDKAIEAYEKVGKEMGII